MPKKQAFEEIVLQAREGERQKYGAAMAANKGPMPFGKEIGEADQDRLWMDTDPALRDPAAFARLVAPKEQGGMGLTPLKASYLKYRHREFLLDGEDGIEAKIAYAEKRRKRTAGMQPAPAPEVPAGVPGVPDPMAQPEMPAAPPQPQPPMPMQPGAMPDPVMGG